jgi:two-component sensor histidine kinase
MEKLNSLANEKKIAVLYLFGMGFYILLSNLTLSLLVQNQALLNTLKNANSWILVLGTTAIFYLVVKSLDQQGDSTNQSKGNNKTTHSTSDKIQEQLIQVLRKAPSPMAILKGENHTYDFVNDAYLKMLGHKKLVGKSVKQAFPEVKEQGLIDRLDNVFKSGKPDLDKGKPLKVNQNGKTKTYYRDFIYYPLTNEEGKVYGIFVQCNNITDQVQAEQQLEQILEERQLLMGELHHRVKNNLTIIAGLLELQADNFQDQEKKLALKSTQTRIYTIADIHEALYHKKSLNKIPLNDFMLDIPERTFAFFDQKTPAVKVFADKESININQAVPLGLLLNEFFTFLAQHHARDLSELTVLTDSSQTPSMTIKIKVNSFKPELVKAFKSSKGFRSTLVSLLLDQLGATLETSISNNSSEINLHFLRKDTSGPYGNNFNEENQQVAHA